MPGNSLYTLYVVFKRFYLFIFRERGEEGEREGKKHQCVVASHAPHTRDLAHCPGMCPDQELNQQPFGSQTSAQSIEPHQPGLSFLSFFKKRFHLFIFREGGREGEREGENKYTIFLQIPFGGGSSLVYLRKEE